MKILNLFFIIFFLVMTCLLGAISSFIYRKQFDFSLLDAHNHKPSIVLDDAGREWGRFTLDRRQPIILVKLPNHLINAFIAAEDHNFFSHSGISFRGIIRSLLVNIYQGKIVQGASTITQQLVKLLFFDAQKTLSRKIKEQLYALLLERRFSKQHILETYLNNVYFGCGIYGIEAASQRFWQKSASDLTIAESATLAAIVKSPAHYCPLLFPLSAQKRRNVVLQSMQLLNFITQVECEKAKNKPVGIHPIQESLEAAYFKEAVRQLAEELVGKHKLYGGGLVIQTTMNYQMQDNAQRLFKKHMDQLKKDINSNINGALLLTEVTSGEIKALIGGYDFAESQFNRALQAKRQIGSIFKPIVYAAALEKGMHFAHTAIDEPFSLQQHNTVWQPKNYSNSFDGQMTLAYALSHSNNIVTIKTLLAVGIEKVIDLAKKFRINAALPPYPSLALGCVDVTLLEAVGLFNTFANSGTYVRPHFIKWIKDSVGTKIYKYEPEIERIISDKCNTQICSVLGLNLERLKKRNQNYNLLCQAICKTGTTNESRTCFFVGSTPQYTTGLYIGCDNNNTLGENIFASGTLFPLWFDLTTSLPQKKMQFDFNSNELQQVTIHSKTGQLTHLQDPQAITIFIPCSTNA